MIGDSNRCSSYGDVERCVQDVADPRLKQKILSFFEDDVLRYVRTIDELKMEAEKVQSYRPNILRKLRSTHREVLLRGEQLASHIKNSRVEKAIKRTFRGIIGNRLTEGKIVKRALEKPRGYPGDYQTLELFYNNVPLSNGFGAYCDKLLLLDSYVCAVRQRKDAMRKILEDFLKTKQRSINILNLGCGSGREIRELCMDNLPLNLKINLTLVDQDAEALTFAKRAIEGKDRRFRVRCFCENLGSLIQARISYGEQFGGQDLVYSIGLADYIPDDYLTGMIRESYNLLNIGGKLIIAHKNLPKHRSSSSDWVCNWNFIPRSVEQFGELTGRSLPFFARENGFWKVSHRASGRIYFLTIMKLLCRKPRLGVQ